MTDGIVVQPATGHWCTVGRPFHGGSWPLPTPSSQQSVTLVWKPGQASNPPTAAGAQVQANTQCPCYGSKYYSTWLRPRLGFRHTNAELL